MRVLVNFLSFPVEGNNGECVSPLTQSEMGNWKRIKSIGLHFKGEGNGLAARSSQRPEVVMQGDEGTC